MGRRPKNWQPGDPPLKNKKHKKPMPPNRWHASQETDELVFAVCDRYFAQLGKTSKDKDPNKPADNSPKQDNQDKPDKQNKQGKPNKPDKPGGAASAVAHWIRQTKGRADITREKVYPLFWEACHRGFLLLQPPTEHHLGKRIESYYGLQKYPGEVTVVNATGETAAQHVTTVAVDKIVELIDRIGKEKKAKYPDDIKKQAVHLGMGAGYAAMLVAKRLAYKIRAGTEVPPIVLHAISAGGFLPNEPYKSPTTYFSFFDPELMNVEFVPLFCATVVHSSDYKNQKGNPAIRNAFEQRDDIDIIVTSFAAADHEHGLLGSYLTHLTEQKFLPQDVLSTMHQAGWLGDVQFRPYSEKGPLPDSVCLVRAITLFELDDMVKMAKDPANGKYIVLIAGPCGECGATKKNALQPLLANEKLRLWTHLITDVRTAQELLEH